MEKKLIEGAKSGFVISSSVCYVRNFAADGCFGYKDRSAVEKLYSDVDLCLVKNGFAKETLGNDPKRALVALCERGLVPPAEAVSDNARAVYLNEPCNIAVSLGGRNNIAILSRVSGDGVKEAYKLASAAEELLDGSVEFAYSERFGYISADVGGVGSGMTLSAVLFLPAEESVPLLGCAAARVGAELLPLHKSSARSSEYSLRYTPSIGEDEADAVEMFASLLHRMIEEEKTAYSIIFDPLRKTITESARRALGILKYAGALTEDETLGFCADVRRAICLDGECAVLEAETGELNAIVALAGSFCVTVAESCTTGEECDIKRAQTVQRILSDTSGRHSFAEKGAEQKNGK